MLVRISTLQPWLGERINGVSYPVEGLENQLAWSDKELAAIDLARPQPFVPVAGKIPSGPAIYILNPDGGVGTTFALSDPPLPETADVLAECNRRIQLVAPPTTQADLNASMTAIEAIPLSGGTLTTAQQAQLQSFIGCMQWIAAMRAACPALVGNAEYQADASWPVCDPALIAFAAQF